MQPTYYVRHPDDSFSEADPQPISGVTAEQMTDLFHVIGRKNGIETISVNGKAEDDSKLVMTLAELFHTLAGGLTGVVSEQVRKALTLAMDICDAVPNRAHNLPEGEPLRHLGMLVNYQEATGAHGYALIRDAKAAFEQAARLSSPPSPPLHGAVGAEPVAWIVRHGGNERGSIYRRKEVAEAIAKNYENGTFGPLIDATPVATQSGAAAAPVDRNAVLEEAAQVCDEIETDRFDAYKGRGKYEPFNPDRADAYVNGESDGAGQCAQAIRKLKSVSAPDGGDDRKEKGE